MIGLTATQAQELTGQIIKDMVFKSEKELTAKYGKLEKTNNPVKDNPDTIDDLLGYYSLTLPFKKLYVNASYSDAKYQNPNNIMISGFKFDLATFYKQLGWDKPIVKQKGQELHITGLKGFVATYNYSSKSLYIRLKNPDIKTFGKKG